MKGDSFRKSAAFKEGREQMNRDMEEVHRLPRLLSKAGYISPQTGKWWQGNYKHGGVTDGMTKGERHGDEGLEISRKTMQPIYDFMALTYDRRFNYMDPAEVPSLDARSLEGKSVTWSGRRAPLLLLDFAADDRRVLRLCDFASAGNGGTPYLTWLHVMHVAPTPFSQTNPLRSGRALTAQTNDQRKPSFPDHY
jgi:hypothetical protein